MKWGKRIIFIGLSLLLLATLACRKEPPQQYQLTVYLLNASHQGNEQAMPLFPGETSIQTIQAVLNTSEEIMAELRKTFGYSRIQLEDFRELPVDKSRENDNFLFQIGNYYLRIRLLPGKNPDAFPLNVAVFPAAAVKISERNDPMQQLYQAALALKQARPLFSVRVTIPRGESVILGRALPDGEEKALFVALQLQPKTRKSPTPKTAKSKKFIVYRDETDLKKREKGSPGSAPQYDQDSIPNVVPFYTLTVKPRPLKQAMPEYPENLRRKGVEDRVIVKILVDEQGKVIRAELLKPSKYAEFNQAALSAAKRFEFEPGATPKGPAKVWLTVPFDFRLKK